MFFIYKNRRKPLYLATKQISLTHTRSLGSASFFATNFIITILVFAVGKGVTRENLENIPDENNAPTLYSVHENCIPQSVLLLLLTLIPVHIGILFRLRYYYYNRVLLLFQIGARKNKE